MKPSPAVQSLPPSLGLLVAVVQESPRWGSSTAMTAAAPGSSRPVLESVLPGKYKVLPSRITPSSPVHSPIRRANAATTS